MSEEEIVDQQPSESIVSPESSGEVAWIDTIPEEYRGTMQARGWDNTTDLAKGYANLVKLHGKNPNVLAMPGEDASDEERASFYQALGRPESADKYDIKIPEGQVADEALLGKIREAAFNSGVSGDQLSSIVDTFHGYLGELIESESQANQVQAENDEAALRQEWGAAFESKVSQARAAMNQFEIDDHQLDALEKAMGVAGATRFLQNIGSRLGEDELVGSSEANSFSNTMSPAEALSEIEVLKGDRDFSASLLDVKHPQHKANLSRWQQLNRYAGGRK